MKLGAVVTGGIRCASGISFLIAPDKANRLWGDNEPPSTTTSVLLRSMGYRDALIGGMLLTAGLRGRSTRGWFLASAGADLADFIGGLSVHDQMSTSQKAKGLGGAVVGVGVGLAGAANGR